MQRGCVEDDGKTKLLRKLSLHGHGLCFVFFKTLVLFSVQSQTISINLLLSKIVNNLVPKCLPVPLRFRKVDGD